MTELSRQLASRVVDALRARARIAVVKGGAAALTRELDAAMAREVAALWPRVRGGEVSAAEVAREIGARAGRALMDSEHVEDVFADEPMLRQEVAEALARALDEAARAAAAHAEATAAAPARPSGLTPVQVRLDMLGYVASTVGKRAAEPVLREALARAADEAGGALTSFDAATREATFALADSDPDARLELEEAVADELSALLDAGVVSLPTVVRRVELPYAIAPDERAAMRPRIDGAAARTLLRSGCAASWDIEDERALRVTVTPMSEQDALDADHYVGLFARELAALPPERERPVAEAEAEPVEEAHAEPIEEAHAEPVEEAHAEAVADAEPAADVVEEAAAAPEAPAPAAARKRGAAKKAPPPRKAPARKAASEPAAAKKAGAKKAAAKPAKKAARKAASRTR